MRGRKRHIIAVDGGGSSCRVAIGVAGGAILATASGSSANATTSFGGAMDSLLTTLEQARASAELDTGDIGAAYAYLGLAGVLNRKIGDAVAKGFPCAHVVVTDDRPTTMAGALAGRDGFVAAIGTGSFLGRQHNDKQRFIGGWGLQLGDQASGGWLGRQALAAVLEWQDGLRPGSDLLVDLLGNFGADPRAIVAFGTIAQPQDFAALAPRILDAADAGDNAALALVTAGADYVQHSLDALGFQRGNGLCLMGGIGLRYGPFLNAAYTGNLMPPHGSALDGAILLASALAMTEGQA